MSHEARAWVWECSQAKGVGRFILLAVAEKAPASTCHAYASLSWLQDMANAGRPAVVKALKDLFASGEMEIVEGETGPFGASVYRLPKALGYVPGSAKSVRSQNRSKEAVSGTDASRPKGNGSLTEPIDDAEPTGGGLGADAIGSLTEPGGSLGEPIEGGCLTEPIGEIGSLTEPAEDGSGGQSVLFGSAIGSVKQPLHENTTTDTSTGKDARAPGASKSTKRSERKANGSREEPQEPDAFAAFWENYPLKTSKPAAVKAWNDAIERNADARKIVVGALEYRNSPRRSKKWTKYPATWLNNDCWGDEYEPDDEPEHSGHHGYQPPIDTSGYFGAI